MRTAGLGRQPPASLRKGVCSDETAFQITKSRLRSTQCLDLGNERPLPNSVELLVTVKAFACGLLIVVASCASSLPQTNSRASQLWSFRPNQLRPIATEAGVSEGTVAAANPSSESAEINSPPAVSPLLSGFQDEIVVSRYAGEFDYRTYRLLHDSEFLKRSEPPPDDLFSRTLNGIFMPEPIRMGKTTVCCSLITAIKRKNPLCLLNPMVLQISW